MLPQTIAPGARLDWTWPFDTLYLEPGETITDATVQVGGGVSKDGNRQLIDGNRNVQQWLRFPSMVGQRCWADCAIVTSLGREDSRRWEFVICVGGAR